MIINLSDDMSSLVRKRAAAAGYADQIEAYVADLIEYDGDEDLGAPPGLSIIGKSEAEIAAMMDESRASGPAIPVTQELWDELLQLACTPSRLANPQR